MLAPKYRPDIDGLRALAVLSVVMFHAFPEILTGGFIGVDIFFVISGYLISSIIYQNLDNNNFSYVEFYIRRIKRIFPALLLVLTACYVFGWFVLLATEYRQLGKHMAASAGFLQNIALWKEAGYFDNSAETKPLLHIWSLCVEEQFYFIWPFLLWFTWKRKINFIVAITLVGIASFACNWYFTSHNPTQAFYLPHTRFWELLSGAWLAWFVRYQKNTHLLWQTKGNNLLNHWIGRAFKINSSYSINNLLSVFGIILLCFGFYYINKGLNFPGTWALIPVAGSIVIIIAGPETWLNRKLLSNKLVVWFGLISYPLYLWHWPMLSFARIIHSETLSKNISISAVILSILLAWCTYKFIEHPIRFKKDHGTIKVIGLILLMLVIFGIGCYTYSYHGFGFRKVVKDNVSLTINGYSGSNTGLVVNSDCGIDTTKTSFQILQQDKRKPIKYALIGDSKAGAIWSGLVRTSSEHGYWLFINSFVPVISTSELYKRHQNQSLAAIDALIKNKEIKVVAIAAATRVIFGLKNDYDISDLPANPNYDIALDGLRNSIKLLVDAGKKIIIVIDNPTLSYPEDCIARTTEIALINRLLIRPTGNAHCSIKLATHLLLSAKYRKLLEELRLSFPGNVYLFDPMKFYCHNGVCSHIDFYTKKPLYSRTDHISDFAAGLVGDELNKFVATIDMA